MDSPPAARAYNFHLVTKSPGAYAHNADYALQLLYDSLEDMQGDLRGAVRPTSREPRTSRNMRTIAVTGSQAGMGLAIRQRLEADGCRVIGVDRPGHGAEVGADLATVEGRQAAVAAVLAASAGVLDGLVCNAGVDVDNPQLVFAVNYMGTVDVMEGLRPALQAAPYAAVVLNISNSIHITPNVPLEPVAALIAGDTAGAEVLLGDREHVAYQVSKMAVARSATTPRPQPRMGRRRHSLQWGWPWSGADRTAEEGSGRPG